MNYPKQLNAFAITKVLGPKPLEAEQGLVAKKIRRHLQERGPFSYDFFRRNVFALVSHQRRLAVLIDECNRSGQPLGRQPNIDLMQHTLGQYSGHTYRTFPVRPTVREIKDGLIVRVNCSLYVVEGNHFSFEVYQPAKTANYSEEQIAFTASMYAEAYLRDDFAHGLIRYWDFAADDSKSPRRAESYSFDSANRISKPLLDRALTVYAKAYDQVIAEGLTSGALRPGKTFEDRQYDFWRP